MKKDILIPEVSEIKIAAVSEYNDVYKTNDWNIYIINEKETAVEMVIIVSKGFDENKKTSVMRKKLELLPAKSFAKIELIQPELFELNNQYQVSFFSDDVLFDKTFLFPKNSIKHEALEFISSMNKKGVLAK